jgi:hypothetical protein
MKTLKVIYFINQVVATVAEKTAASKIAVDLKTSDNDVRVVYRQARYTENIACGHESAYAYAGAITASARAFAERQKIVIIDGKSVDQSEHVADTKKKKKGD